MNKEILKNISILYVEDESDVREFTSKLLSSLLKNVFTAENGQDGLDLYKENINTIDLIVTDINMPKMNGIEFLKIMRENEKLKNISVFVMTTSNEDSDKINAYNLNVAGYILKPLSFEKFLVSVATLKNFWQLCEM